MHYFSSINIPKLGSIIPVIFLNIDQSTPLFGQQYHRVLIDFLSVELLELCAILKKLKINVSELDN